MSRKNEKLRFAALVSKEKFPAVVYGLDGIMDIFDVSKSTAFRYRHGIIEKACTQQGKVIIVDVAKALELFGMPDASLLVEDAGR